MLGEFTYYNPTVLHFGKNAVSALADEISRYGTRVLLVYGGGSIKSNGVYDDVMEQLRACRAEVVELPGVMPNPTYRKLLEGAELARQRDVDIILGVGGGSVADYCKAVAASAWCEEDPWEKYYVRMEEPACRVIPVGCVLTMVGTGSEMNGGAVITNEEKGMKVGKVFGPALFPRFAILDPEYTFTVPEYQMVAGIFDIMSHLMEQYFSGEDDNTSDYVMEGLMRSLIRSSLAAVKDPLDYEARSNIMWTSTWALNTFVSKGKSEDWEVHMIGQAVGAHTDATHGMTLSAVSLPYYRMVKPYGLKKFVRFAVNVWDVDPAGMSDDHVADLGLAALRAWMISIGVVMNLSKLGVTEDMLEAIADSTFLLSDGYKSLTRSDVISILRESL